MGTEIDFGWFIPTMGDTARIGDPTSSTPPSLDLFTHIAQTAEDAGFTYLLVPVMPECYEAYISCAMVSARTQRIDMLVAARAGFIAPPVMAKMLSTFDQLSGGRLRVNLITGGDSAEMAADGLFYDHDERYDVLTETVEILKDAWTRDEPFDVDGRYFTARGVHVQPRPVQAPHPPLYLGGMSESARELCASHADVHLFWGDTPANIAKNVQDMTARAAAKGRTLDFGMRLQVIVRETEEQAWAAAEDLISAASAEHRESVQGRWSESKANDRMKELAQAEGHLVGEHLWSGIATVRHGAGIAIVGNPEQVADTIAEFVDAGCSSFCLSGYPHADEAARFGHLVMPLLRERFAVKGARPGGRDSAEDTTPAAALVGSDG
ncbi:alkanesulfonate monooxygenase [Citricoccus zhacaiensis]|uniref:Alkanesulfonate monooxygenase n=1 Tax=Citricoccus zhacaiensis TaxID=489142 RepID=A0ABQ2LSL1_9MICC|nr:LLM class flavin-dependent oxidoreductase [Citricoccus zhacaiensis]GGO42809.1 alkanesulfonate monooxygenase [Citricoccus zhacaiensis]